MKKIFLLLCLIIFNFSVASAEKMDSEREKFICALSSAAAYQDETGELSGKFLNSRGWEIEKVINYSPKVNVKIHIMSRVESDGEITEVLFITGTEDIKDAEVDMKMDPVPFNDGDKNILVHRGFKTYADAALSEGNLEYVVEYINTHPHEKFYITGHSLGGAVATVIAARLADAGADMQNVKVVTFGAPAVGNKYFAEKYKDKIHLTRVVMSNDVIKNSTEIFGYAHFGEVVKFQPIKSSTQNEHAISLYLDCAIRKLYDAGLKINSQKKIKTPVYIAPIMIVDKSFDKFDEKYIKEVLIDQYAAEFANVTFAAPNFDTIKKAADFSYNVKEHIDAAKKSGSKFIILPLIYTKPVREERQNTSRVFIEETIFDSNGKLMTMNTSGMTSKDVTILDAVFLVQEILNDNREQAVKQ